MRRFVNALIVLLAGFAWLGTRYIWKFGSIAGWPTEFGTLGVFATELLAFEIAALTAIEAWHRRAALFKNGAVPASLALLALAYASAAWSLDVSYALLSGDRILLGIGVMIAMIVWRPSRAAVLGALVFGAAVNSLLGVGQFLTQSVGSSLWFGIAGHLPSELGAFVVETADARWLRAYGALAHPNILGLLAAVGILAIVGLLRQSKRRGQRAALLGLTAILAAGLAVSVSRGAVLSLLVGLCAIGAALFASNARIEAKLLLRSAAIVAIVIALFAGFFPDVFLTRISASGRLERQSIDDRLWSYHDARTLIAASPLVGVGVGQMPGVVQAVNGGGRHPSQFQPAHNEALLVAAELGLLGLIAWLLLRIRIIAALLKAIRAGGEEKILNAAILGIIAALLTAGLVDHFLWTSWFGQLLFWLTAGLALSTED
ncbi:O-antigen ligase family protein [Candidatus Uhrbacteria bacterium]|nr:O-antigen ligase family protein [Candidatus Uhrbacteria bacterium]